MAIGTAILLGVALYLVAALPFAVVIGRMLGGRSEPALAGASGVAALTQPARVPLAGVGLSAAHVAASRPVALVARQARSGRDLQLAGAEAHPAHA